METRVAAPAAGRGRARRGARRGLSEAVVGLYSTPLYLFAFLPLFWISSSGLLSRHLGVFVALVLLVLCTTRGLLPKLLLCLPTATLGCTYLLILGQYEHDLFGYTTRDLLTSLTYGLVAGVFLADARRRKEDKSAILAMVITGLLGSAAAYIMVQVTGGSVFLTGGGEVERQSVQEAYSVFGILGSANTIIGVIPMTIITLSIAGLLIFGAFSVYGAIQMVALSLALIACFSVATRTSVTAGLITTGLVMVLFSGVREVRKRLLHSVPSLLLVAIILGIFLLPKLDTLLEPFQVRFATLTSDSRFDLWSEGATLLALHPGGGGYRDMTMHLWAHNLFLDVGLTCGVLGFVVIILIELAGLVGLWRLYRLRRFSPFELDVWIGAATIGYFLCAMTMPPDSASLAMAFIAASYFRTRIQTEQAAVRKSWLERIMKASARDIRHKAARPAVA